ncbi:hypothetical protein P691DRAFT_780620 [Macrolepiota fuliginosa MF-IS2]|uniref:Uncharacterized protein n=1 Tax=Macrolepiota fuliginosa MF-IS2 TaxID=1400762 RepID=A0A9P6BV16_9AGAR|nr:hypothetical protein P691DRAFT_780620 [Macrolepiota fuliginosa MF-IS2]
MASYLLANIKPLTGSENYCNWSFDMLQALNSTMHKGMNAGLITLGMLPHPTELLEHWVMDPTWDPTDHPAGAVPPQIVATCFSGHHACILSKLAQLNNLIDEFSAQEIIPASICTILMLCMMPKSWEEMQNMLLHMHHNNLAQLTPDIIGQACQIAATSHSFSIAHEASATPAKQLGIQKGGSTPKWNKQGGQNSQQQQGQQPKPQQPAADSKAPSGDKEDSTPQKHGCRGGKNQKKNQKKNQGARGTANVVTSGDNFVQPPGSGVALIPLPAITSAFTIVTPTTVTM